VGANEIVSCQAQSDNAEIIQVKTGCTSASRNCLKRKREESNTIGLETRFLTTENPSPKDVDTFIQL